jgi:hypothetical protein
MKKLLLCLAIATASTIQAQPWVFTPAETVSKYWNPGISDWDLFANSSIKTEYNYLGSNTDYFISKKYDGTSFNVEVGDIKIEHTYNGTKLDYTIVKFWDGASYEISSYSTKTEYYYIGDKVDYTLVKYWDGANWYIGYQWIGTLSTKTEHYYNGNDLEYTISKYYDGANWYIGYQQIGVMSIRTEYTYVGGKLDNTITKYYNGSNWYIGYQYIYDMSIKTNYTYSGNTLIHTITEYYDGATWYLRIQNSPQSMKTEYIMYSPVAVAERENIASANIYPNPASDVINLETEKNMTLKIFDATLKEVRSANLLAGRSRLSTQDLDRGIYFFQFCDAEGNKCQRKVVVD